MRPFASLLLLAAAVAPALASAESYTYTVNDHYAGFSVAGTITTDTNQGTLATADILSYSLTLNDGTTSLLVNPGNSGEEVIGDGLTATSTGLYFNFAGLLGNQFIIQNPYVMSGTNYLCYQDAAGGCDDFDTAHESIELGSHPRKVALLTGDPAIAVAAAPEPGSFALLGTGLLGTAGLLRRRLIA